MLAKCHDAKLDVEFLDAIGYDTQGDRERLEHLQSMCEAGLLVQRRAKEGR